MNVTSARRRPQLDSPMLVAIRLPSSPPGWSEETPHTQPDARLKMPGLSSETAGQLATLDMGPRLYHHSDGPYVKLEALFANDIVSSRRRSRQIIRLLQKRAVIVEKVQMVSDWTHIAARHGAEELTPDATTEQDSRRFVCMAQAFNTLQHMRLGFFGRRLRTEQIYRILEFLSEFKRISENRCACGYMLSERQKRYEQRRRELQAVVDTCMRQVWDDGYAWQLRYDMVHLRRLTTPAPLQPPTRTVQSPPQAQVSRTTRPSTTPARA